MENTRLLHSELCELLIIYGLMLLSLFTFNFINMLLCFHFGVISGSLAVRFTTKSVWQKITLLTLQVQSVTFLMSIIISVSIINDKVPNYRLKIISYLRLYRVSNLHLDIKRQIKMFMNQILACDADQISAFGFFDINLNLVTSILVLLISGMITLIQMQNHPIILKFNNNTQPRLPSYKIV
ncbi:Uncharacterized protein FWK35_00016697 [Aphis craccivora]|uniref:Gustatory receptor n=1 Tax=Aphis craccivora TaxID=307492 RepID=A0A6G0Y188_APHCR|nr:Uncharacterized protein FWK35_00016697 [Aphis craccivora]